MVCRIRHQKWFDAKGAENSHGKIEVFTRFAKFFVDSSSLIPQPSLTSESGTAECGKSEHFFNPAALESRTADELFLIIQQSIFERATNQRV